MLVMNKFLPYTSVFVIASIALLGCSGSKSEAPTTNPKKSLSPLANPQGISSEKAPSGDAEYSEKFRLVLANYLDERNKGRQLSEAAFAETSKGKLSTKSIDALKLHNSKMRDLIKSFKNSPVPTKYQEFIEGYSKLEIEGADLYEQMIGIITKGDEQAARSLSIKMIQHQKRESDELNTLTGGQGVAKFFGWKDEKESNTTVKANRGKDGKALYDRVQEYFGEDEFGAKLSEQALKEFNKGNVRKVVIDELRKCAENMRSFIDEMKVIQFEPKYKTFVEGFAKNETEGIQIFEEIITALEKHDKNSLNALSKKMSEYQDRRGPTNKNLTNGQKLSEFCGVKK